MAEAVTESPKTPRDERELTIIEHLLELRTRLIVAVIAVVIGMVIGMMFTQNFLEVLLVPLGDYVPQTIEPTESLVVYFKIALILGLIGAMPVIVYEIIAFILPAMLPNERRYLYFMLPGVTIFFAGGIAFAAYVMLPAAITFMQGFLSEIVNNQWTLQSYVSFTTRVMFWMGVVFQTPLLMYLFARMGIVTSQQYAKARKYAIVIAAVVAALVTPTPDPINMVIVMVPIYFLFEIGVLLSKLARPMKHEQEPAS